MWTVDNMRPIHTFFLDFTSSTSTSNSTILGYVVIRFTFTFYSFSNENVRERVERAKVNPSIVELLIPGFG